MRMYVSVPERTCLLLSVTYASYTACMQNAVVFYSYGVGCRWLASKDSSRTSVKEPLKLWQVYIAGMTASAVPQPLPSLIHAMSKMQTCPV